MAKGIRNYMLIIVGAVPSGVVFIPVLKCSEQESALVSICVSLGFPVLKKL